MKEARLAGLGEYSQSILSEALWTPNIASSQFDKYPFGPVLNWANFCFANLVLGNSRT